MEDENESLIDESGDEGTWFHFRGKAESFVIEMEQQASRLVDMVHGERR